MQSRPKEESKATARRRGGRPSADQIGEVDRRILDAATKHFLRLGFDATSCDQVVVEAKVGKASLYARYANKEELFAAVVRRSVDRTLLPSADLPWHLPVRERLQAVGHSLLAYTLTDDAVALMRALIMTAHRMPHLAQSVDQIGRDGGVLCVARAIAGVHASPEMIERASIVAGEFIDMVFVPQQMRALIGDDREKLDAAAPRRIDHAIDLLWRAGRLNTFDTW